MTDSKFASADDRIKREIDALLDDLIARGFVTTVRIRRDGQRVFRFSPGASEWWEASAAYVAARDDEGRATEAQRQRVRRAWQALDGKVKWDDDEQALLHEVMQFQ
jgi:hypothetical protein